MCIALLSLRRILIKLPIFQHQNFYILLILSYSMDSFTIWMPREVSEKQGKSRLSQISEMIDWSPIGRILNEMYDNKSDKVEGPSG